MIDNILSDTTIWVGFDNFKRFFSDPQFWPLMKNTFLLCMLLCGLPVPAGLREKLASWLDSMTDETQVDVVMETAKPGVLDDSGTAAAARRFVDDDREDSGLLDM